ncbi:MAG: SCO family protein [Massilia sp.]
MLQRLSVLLAGLIGAAMLAGALRLLAEHGRRDSALAHTALPYYASADLRPRWDWLSRRHRVGRFALRDQRGAAFDQAVLDNGPTVVSFFFSACTSVCPVSTELLLRAQANLRRTRAGGAPRFLSISVTPQHDTPQALREYASKTGLPAEWRLATGAPGEIAALARRGFFSDVGTLGADGLPVHLNRAFLVDREHHLRGVYDATRPADIVRLQHDAASL